jgi:hypothetical protein
VYGYRINEVIKGRPEVMNSVREHQGPTDDVRLLLAAVNEPVLGELSVFLVGDVVEVAVNPGLDLIVKGDKVAR